MATITTGPLTDQDLDALTDAAELLAGLFG